MLLLSLLLLHFRELNFIQDDAYTTFRYVKNFLAGKGLVFNAGERVEGYTNFLWLLFLIPSAKFFDLPSFAQHLAMFFGTVLVLLLPFFTQKVIGLKNKLVVEVILILLPSFILVFNADFIYWTVSGMETALYLLLFLAVVIAKVSNSRVFLPLAVLTALTRPEGFLVFIVIEAHDFLFNYFVNKKNVFRKVVTETGLFFLLVFPHFFFRYFYYGNFLPNTFYAKTGWDVYHIERGLNYFADYFSHSYSLLFLALPVVFSLPLLKKNYNVSLLLTIITVFLLYNILIGGDVLPMGRFFLPPFLLSAILFVNVLHEAIEWIKKKKGLLFVNGTLFILLISFALFLFVSYANRERQAQSWRAFEKGLVYKMKIYAKSIKAKQQREKRKVVVALSTIGAFSYYSDAEVIDLIGLTDSYIAHNPKELKGIGENISVLWRERHYNAEYVLNRKPDFILFPAGIKPSAYPEAAIFSSPQFWNNYFVKLIPSTQLGEYLPIFALIPDSLKTLLPPPQGKCEVKATEYYIRASNNFLAFLKYGKEKFVRKVFEYADSLIAFCPVRKHLAFNLKGMAEFHSGRSEEAEKYFLKAISFYPIDTPSLSYLVNIYRRKGEFRKEITTYLKLKRLNFL